MMGLLLPLGIEKGKEFKPAATTQSAMAQSARDAHAWLMNGLLTSNTAFWPTSSWSFPAAPVGAETAFSFGRPNYLDLDARALVYFLAYAPPKKLGAATFYVGTYKDANGDLLRGEESYKLHVPPNVPARQFWALTLYDRETCAFIRDMMRNYNPEYLVPGHGQIVAGAQNVATMLTNYRDAMQYVQDQSIRLMNMGYTPDEIAETVKLPEAVQVEPWGIEYYGNVVPATCTAASSVGGTAIRPS